MDLNPNKKNCWNCFYQKLGGVLFFGKCTWFTQNQKGEDKDIPNNVVDRGCKYYKDSEAGKLF